ncbi:DNA ligase D [Pareuzebyella sediminis]|uniref:DNA ligase D n=1 Tax=Pareuzebyella sediminis TaxID=2607998 RepID=UPI0011EE1D30|nr:DNA ligase D [Pareuzebyella sediminis]
MDLREYNKKRDFTKTPEPKGDVIPYVPSQRFVFQRHQARRLHYDLRLEIGGTLKSWAIPKGPSMNPADKRLAVRTEDHPISYLNFHGTIPKGSYGAGEMIIWDAGTFDIERTELDLPVEEQLADGNLKLLLHGWHIKGKFALVRTGIRNGQENWLLIKKKDDFATDLFYSAEDLVKGSDGRLSKYSGTIIPHTIIQPMLASNKNKIFNHPDWLYELKWDGYRVLAHISDNGVLLQSRNGIDLNVKFILLKEELEGIAHECILDGEVVILDKDGVSQFGRLQNYPETEGVLCYYVFDMLYLNGHSMINLSLTDRKSLIPNVIEGLHTTKYCDHVQGMGTALYDKAIEAGMEGVMAKHKDSTYSLSSRTEQWLKIKAVQSVDAFICGYTESTAAGVAFGSLILGTASGDGYDYIGNCGSGFSDSNRKELRELFQKYKAEKSPFGKKLPLKGRQPNWLEPTLMCEVKYSETTKNGLLRNPVYKKLLNPPSHETKPKATSRIITSSTAAESVSIDGFQVPISSIDKLYFPESGLTKYDLIDYYLQISEFLLPHLIDRPQSLHRHPNGISSEDFYQKDNDYLPEWMKTISIYSKSSERDINYLLCQNTASLIYMANMGCIEINPWNSRIGKIDFPDYGIIDLDPPEGVDFAQVIRIAREAKSILDAGGIKGFLKTSGSKGLHIYIPMGAQYTYEEVRNFIKLLCHFILDKCADVATLERALKKRNGKIYLDYLQNRKGQTIASVYSVRPLPGAPVSMPIEWDELEAGLSPQQYTQKNVPQRLVSKKDIFKPMLESSLDMKEALDKLITVYG